MRVWLVGAAGMLAQAVRRRLDAAGVPWVGSDREVDISRAQDVMAFAADHKFTHLLNCAAYTKVDDCETHAEMAQAVNGTGPGYLAAAAQKMGAMALHISTDYVFDGTHHEPYAESAACAPLGVYGRSKRQGEEQFWRALTGGRGFVIRTSWLFGHGGPNFVATMLRLMAEREALRVVADQMGRPTYCDDLAAAMLALTGITSDAGPAAYGVYHFANAGEVSWHGFAASILAQAKACGMQLLCDVVHPIATQDYPTPARRPAYSVLATDKIAAALGAPPRAWSAALDSYLSRH